MPVDLSIKRVPDELAERLRERAKRNHRSLQGELRAILEEAARERRKLTVDDLLDWNQRRGISSPATSTQMIREDRDDPRR